MKKKMNPVDQLFDFIERQDFDGAEAIITQSPNFDINETNAEDHTPLDVAVMTDAVVIAKLIMKHGGKENPIFIKNRYIRSVRLTTLVTEAEEQVEKLTTSVVNLGGGMPNGVGVNHPQGSLTASSSKLKEYERQLRDWEWRYHTLRRMLQIYDRAKASEPPKWVKLSVMSPTALRVDFDEPEETNGAVVTRYKIVWSAFPDYTDSNEFVKTDLQVMCHIIEDLDEDVTYYVYVEAFNMQGYSAPCYSTPSCATPSNWRTAVNDCNTDGGSNGTDDAILTHVPDRSCTSHDTMMTLDGLAQSVLDADTEDALDSRGLKRNWFKMFGGKFTHTLEAGSLYLAVVNYTDDNRLQVTADGHLPILLVDQDHSVGQHSADIMWFSKICFNWKDTRSLKAMIGSDQSTATLVFRHKLLLAAIQAQLTFNQPNLGILHPDIITDFNKCTIVTVMKQVPRSQSAGSGNRWIPIPRFLRKRVHPDRPNTPGNVEKPDIGVSVSASTNSVRQDISPPPHSQNTSAYTLLVNQLLDVVSFHTNMHETLPRGLYVGLLKLRTTVSHMSVYTSRLHPLMLPYMKISDNPNVSRDEWLWLQRVMNQTQDSNVHPLPDEVTQHGRTFQQRLARGAARLLTKFNLDDGEEDVMENYHLYCREVIEVSDDITMVLLLPPADSLCLAPGQQCVLDENPDIVPLPLHYFELAHKVMFSQPFCDLYTRVSSVLDCRRLCSEQLSRKAFTKEETLAAQIELDEVNHLQSDLDAVWDKMRWVRDIVHQGKDKLPSCTVVLRRMFTAGVGTSSAHALPSFARRGARGVNTRRSLQHNSWSSNSVRLQQQQQLLLQQAKRQRNHLQRRASLETTEIFNDIVDKSNGPANGGANNSTTLRQGGDGGGGARDAGNRQATMPTNRRGSLPSVGYVGGAGSFSTLPRSSRRSSSTHGALLEERSESSHATGNAAVGHHSRSSAAMDRATQSASESNTVMSDPNISRHKADSAGNVHSHSVMHRRHAHAQAGSPDDELSRSFPHGSPVHALTDNMDKGRASPAPPKRSSSHAAMNVHRLSRTGSPQYSEDGGEHPPPYTSSSNSVSPDGTLGRQHAAQQRHHHTMTMATSPDGTFVQQGGNMGAVANAVGALEHTRGSPMNAHGTTPSPDSMTYSSSSYSGSSSASSTFSRSSSSRVNTGHAVATGNRSLSPSNSSGSFSSARSGGHVTSSSSPDEFGSGNIATLQLSAGSSSSNRSSTLPASTASRIHPSAPAGKTLYARTDSSGASTFQRTPPLRRKQPGGASAVTQHQQSQAEEQSHHLTHQHAAPPSAGNAKRSSVPTGPTTSSSSQQPPVHGGDGQFGRFGARVPAPQQAPPPPTYAHPQRHNTTTTAAAATNHHSPASSFASVDRAARPHGRPRRSISDTSFGSPPSQQQQQKQQYEQQQQHVQQQQQSSTARVMRTQATQSHLHRRTYLETGGDSGSDRSARSSPTPAGSLLTPGGISTSGANWVRVFPLFASPQLLAKGTNIKIKITPTTSCREVIELVMDEVRRLTSGSTRAQSLILDINAYCLVSKVEGRDCPLPDDFKPLELADQESRRQMYIRERSAAEQMLQQGQSTSV
ncbi:uncharacterized protein LOC135825147 [Sycon ciliatum]|uniref:uncharacterized protein LOC135825147 n=1 Tax=Sycon ciliatum TaxID=27933 RepID=UPI0031F63188